MKSVLYYGSETWRTRMKNNQKLQISSTAALEGTFAFFGQKSSVMMGFGKEKEKKRTRQMQVDKQLIQMRWRWFEHTLCNWILIPPDWLLLGTDRERDIEGGQERRGSMVLQQMLRKVDRNGESWNRRHKNKENGGSWLRTYALGLRLWPTSHGWGQLQLKLCNW